MDQQTGQRRTVVIGPPPTPNGDLHVGHIAGPYMAADVHARYLRATGQPVLYTTGTDDSQTYVVSSAAKLGTTPDALAAKSWREIRETLGLMGISVDGFAPFDDGYRAMVVDFLTRLHDAGRFRLRTVKLPYVEATGEFLMEGLVSGGCPVCLAVSRGGLCESCGHPNNFTELTDPRSTVDPTAEVTYRETEILVLPLEEYREQLTAYHRAKESTWRPHIVQLMRELLARPLPDFPITYPTGWGIPAPFPQTPGQVVNAWAEGMPASMYCTAVAQRAHGERPATDDELWLAGNGVRLVYFLGFDNAYFWGLTHLSLLLAHEGRYVVPDAIVSNEFYELENEKFSTSKGHVVWTRDLVREVPRDLVRFHLALTAPEHARTNFSRAALEKITGERLVGPWNRLGALLGKAVAELGLEGQELPVSPEANARRAAMAERFEAGYRLTGYSLSRTADLIPLHTERLLDRAEALSAGPALADRTASAAELGDLFAEVRTLIAAASPILIDLAERARAEGGFDGTFAVAPEERTTTPFTVPALGRTTAES
ncbi:MULTISPECIES: class I tRNA ligase family protein [Streptomyces]|uniref:class I tRNA ligase family protein n=1 Tax=Streptomyces TaxID=1883 RepID=UPI0004CC12B1|nr:MULTISPECIES: class I tRNA ligase family protein [unclassified Streptomyces]KOV83044.1 methionine--tRNA ligase [Streptomyces sp. NRRL WC-3723]